MENKNKDELSFSLDERLSVVASLCKDGCVFADIGTDHGMVPCYLVKKKSSPNGFACDINEKPLEKAVNLIKKEGLSENIECILSDGVPMSIKDKVNTVIIAGMGGETINHIIETANLPKNSDIHFILQPMTKANLLRRFLFLNGYKILEEVPCTANGKVYTVMDCIYTGESHETCDELFLNFGTLIFKENLTKTDALYLNFIYEKLSRIYNGLCHSSSQDESETKALSKLLERAKEKIQTNSPKEEK